MTLLRYKRGLIFNWHNKDIPWKKYYLILIGFRILILTICAFLPLSLPGVWRQTDTLGVSMRYWMRWTVEPHASLTLLPAVLNSGDTNGINAMEFPLLNLIFSPAFSLGPYWGKVIAMLGVLFLVHGLLYLNYRVWKDHHHTLGIDSFAFFLIAVATFSSGWTGKFIPDLISVLFVLLGLGLSWEKTRFLNSSLLCTTGLLMKPTSIVVMFLFLVHPNFFERIRKNFLWILIAIAITLFYYTVGIHWIQKYQAGNGIFAVELKPIFQNFINFFSNVTDWTNMWTYRAFFSLGIFPVLPLSVIAVVKKIPQYGHFIRMWITFLLQYLAIAMLAGSHGFMHDYYFMGLAPTACLLLWWLIMRPWPKFVLWIIFIGIMVPTLELSLMDLRSLYKPGYQEFLHLFRDCHMIKSQHPEIPWNQGVVFRSSPEPYPALGLCFGEREGSMTSKYGFFWNNNEMPKQCQPIEIKNKITLAKCY